MSRTINRILMSLSAALGVALAMATAAQAAVGTSHPGRFAGYTESTGSDGTEFGIVVGVFVGLMALLLGGIVLSRIRGRAGGESRAPVVSS
jgi:tetrahydromethanopterin S-methyltransferase subunit B